MAFISGVLIYETTKQSNEYQGFYGEDQTKCDLYSHSLISSYEFQLCLLIFHNLESIFEKHLVKEGVM